MPECINYYGDIEFDKNELVKSGVDPEAVGVAVNPAVPRKRVSRPGITNGFRGNSFSSVQLPAFDDYEEELEEVREEPRRPRPRPSIDNSRKIKDRPVQLNRPIQPAAKPIRPSNSIVNRPAPSRKLSFPVPRPQNQILH